MSDTVEQTRREILEQAVQDQDALLKELVSKQELVAGDTAKKRERLGQLSDELFAEEIRVQREKQRLSEDLKEAQRVIQAAREHAEQRSAEIVSRCLLEEKAAIARKEGAERREEQAQAQLRDVMGRLDAAHRQYAHIVALSRELRRAVQELPE